MKSIRNFIAIAPFCLLAGLLPGAPQNPPAGTAQPKAATSKGAVKTAPKGAAQNASAKKAPLTKPETLERWNGGEQQLFLNELKLRGLAFEPEEDWVAGLKNPDAMPLAIDALRKLIPPAPTVDDVTAQAPDLLAKIKDAAQKRNDQALAELIHPELMPNKAAVYDLFDTTNYRGHSLGVYAPTTTNRQVGVQFFELTTSQVERLYYVTFATSRGKIVLRDVLTGKDIVTRYFLRDEETIAKSKLELVFRALNDGDDTGLKNLCTPGLYQSLKDKTGDEGGSLLTRGQHVPIDSIKRDASASLDQKSVRVVVRVSYPTAGKQPLQYDVDFERVDKDLKVVRVRDLQGGVIAWDPDIDNYLNRRYGLPDGPQITDVPESNDPRFYPLPALRAKAMRALENRDPKKLKDCADELLERKPNSGEGYGMRASSEAITGNYDNAVVDAGRALERGGTVYFDVMQYGGAMSHSLTPAILAVSKGKVEIRQVMSGPGSEIPAASVKTSFDGQANNGGGIGGLLKSNLVKAIDPPGPFLKVDVAGQKNKTYKFAAVGTQCPDANSARDKNLEQYPGGNCGSEGTMQNPRLINMMVPHEWFQDLKVVADTLDAAKAAPKGKSKN